MRHTQITIHQAHIAHNVNVLKSKTHAKFLAMVKANAYGHGVSAVVPALTQADGFGVACFSEAVAVKSCLAPNDHRPIVLIEGVFSESEWQQAINENFMAVVHNDTQLGYALAHTPPQDSHTRTIWLKFNTGMNRLGFNKTTVIQSAHALINKGYRLVLTSHFACGDEPAHPLTAQQLTDFDEVLSRLKAQFPQVQGSLCNSAGIINFPNAHYDWVRAGIAMYGASPFADITASELNLKPAMTLSAQILATHTLQTGETVGYGGLWTAQKPSKIAIISIGYGDGYPRVVQGATVTINGQTAPIIGRVAMDMTAIDITDLTASLNDTVILWGDSPSIDTIARCAGTIGYELMCKITDRPNRMID